MEIENSLYGQGGTHAVVGVALSPDRLILTVAPWAELASVKVAEFSGTRAVSVKVNADDRDGQSMPWGIIGFDSYPLHNSRWRFVL